MEKVKDDKEAVGEIETEHPGYLGAQDMYYVGTVKGIGRIYQQTFIDSYSKVALLKHYHRKNALVAADMLNGRGLPFFEEHEIPLRRILTDRGTQFCGAREHHEYQLCLAVENIDHSKTKARHPRTNGICERIHKTIQDEFYQTAFHKKVYTTLEELQNDTDAWIDDTQHSENTLRQILLRQDSDADVLGLDSIGKEQNARHFTRHPRRPWSCRLTHNCQMMS